jgi:hypothetical protein
MILCLEIYLSHSKISTVHRAKRLFHTKKVVAMAWRVKNVGP